MTTALAMSRTLTMRRMAVRASMTSPLWWTPNATTEVTKQPGNYARLCLPADLSNTLRILMITLIAETGTNGFKPDRFHCLEMIHIETSDIFSFSDDKRACLDPISYGVALLEAADHVISHGFLQFDLKWLEMLRGAKIAPEKVRDTLRQPYAVPRSAQ